MNSPPIISNEWEHMYKLVAVDLDETLLNDARHVPLRVRRAIELARAKAFTSYRHLVEALLLCNTFSMKLAQKT